jgi:putative hydrolase of the HAD superfamily
MTTSRRFDAVLFDVGGVLSVPLVEVFLERITAARVDLAVVGPPLLAAFASDGDGASDHPAHRLERGEITLEAFFDALGPDGDSVRVLLDPSSPHFGPGGLRPHAGMHALAADARAAGMAVGVLSNTVREWQPAWDAVVPTGTDAAIWSWAVGMRKPDPEIYRLAYRALDVAPERVLFLDDFPTMADAARTVGMTALDVTDHDTAIARARTLLGWSGPAH